MAKIVRNSHLLIFLCTLISALELGNLSKANIICPEQCSCDVSSSITIFCGYHADETFHRLNHVPKNIPIQSTTLSLRGNNITIVSEHSFRNLTSLRNLNLRENRLVALPAGVFRDLNELKSLNLGANKLAYLADKVFEGLHTIEELFLDNNNLQAISEKLFEGLSSLRFLHLHKNALHTFPEKALHGTINLRGLWLTDNQLTHIHKNTFKKVTRLQILNLGNNKLTSLDRNIFTNLSALEMLFVDQNNLATLPHGIFKSLPQDAKVSLKNNPFVCDCKLHWFKAWIISMQLIFSRDKIRCSQPPELAGRSIVTITNKQFTCSKGQWGSWSAWGPCSKTCGLGRRRSVRACITTEEGWGRAECPGSNTRWGSCVYNHCSVDGGWTEWSAWTKCSTTCSTGFKIRFRNCTNPVPQSAGKNCTGNAYESSPCQLPDCPAKEIWSKWTTWSDCSVTCGFGKRTRSRTCFDIKRCKTESSTELSPCYLGPCPINGQWSVWTSWTACSTSCSKGTRVRTRTCNNPPPKYGGLFCNGNSTELTSCILRPCPINGAWSNWNSWTKCSTSCSNGTRTRSRSCNNPRPKYGGLLCKGNSTELLSCYLRRCPIHGQWSNWNSWTACSTSCSNGTIVRTRTCNNPSPSNGGLFCKGNATELSSCYLRPCPINGQWSNWTSWTSCSISCSNGTKSRTRTCDNPSPKYEGLSCDGNSIEVSACAAKPCPIDGSWSSWLPWSPCSKSCSAGYRVRKRTCNNPKPHYGGKNCLGISFMKELCNVKQCSQWSQWSNWTSCSLTCGNGTQRRTRTCVYANCSGQNKEVKQCFNSFCHIDGGWSLWTLWSPCSKSCSMGTRTRLRNCSKPIPQFGGKLCNGPARQVESCFDNPLCEGVWSKWSQWSLCSSSCSNGTRHRSRNCTTKHLSSHNECKGNASDLDKCNLQECPINGAWSEWGVWGPCTTRCSNGTKTRHRTCTNPKPSHGGSDCQGRSNETIVCNLKDCIHFQWSQWSNWSDCSKTYDQNYRTRIRNCLRNNHNIVNSSYCLGNNYQYTPCNVTSCIIDSSWNSWSPWTQCSVSCDVGIQERFRNCSTALSYSRTTNCTGASKEARVCYTQDCVTSHGWSSWSNWTSCSKTCDYGIQVRSRDCNGNKPCKGENLMVRSCQIISCDILRSTKVSWLPWTHWTKCSATCGRGHQMKWRFCYTRKINATKCTYDKPYEVKTRECMIKPCNYSSVWTTWTKWEGCNKPCHLGGVRRRVRYCLSQAVGIKCKGKAVDIRSCNKSNCQATKPPATYPPLVELGSPIPCPDPGTPRNGKRKFIDQIQFGSYYVAYSCNKHFTIDGPKLRHCESNNQWSDVMPECLPVCGKSSSVYAHRRLRIVGGSPTMPGRWPWQVALEFNTFQSEFNSFHCGGTLIAENWVVTAAHCVVYRDTQIPYHGVRVYLGVHDITKRHWDNNVQIIPSAQIISHPKFSWKTYDSDLALIRLRWRANITDFVKPVCLPNGYQRRSMKPGKEGAMLGWGITEKRKAATALREVFIPIVDHKSCKKAYENETWPVTTNMLCAGNDLLSKDSCNRDSGGGFVIFDGRTRKRRWFLGGVISWGNPKCGIPGKYSVFTKITHSYVKWIRHQMNKFKHKN